MKQRFRKLAMVAVAVMIFSVLTGYAYAAPNTTFRSFSITSSSGSYTAVEAKPQAKTDSSAMFVTVASGSAGSVYNVRAMGCPDWADNVDAENVTLYNNAPADHVVCVQTTYYSVRNTVRENGYRYGVVAISHNGGYGTVTGQWASDTGQTYTTPSAP